MTIADLPLLATKFYIPRVHPGLVHRPRLLERLSLGLRCPLTLLSAPAGFGKTTLLGEWHAAAFADREGYRLAWLALDAGDNDPVRFWRYFFAAFDAACPGSARLAMALLESPESPLTELMLTTLVNELASVPAGSEIFLALDDYHVVEAPDIHNGVAFVLEHLPPNVHMIISSRATPPLPLARMRARGQLSEVGVDDLRFTREESTLLLHSLLGEPLPISSLNTLEKQTEGWAAGLQLAALSLRGSVDIPGQIATYGGSNRLVLEYVTEEVLRRQPADVQRFLLHTSILGRFTADLCNAVTGNRDGQAMLEVLERENLFLVPQDEEQRWYRYHHLFASLLRQKLRRVLPESIAQLHRLAAQWYEKQGLLTSAIEHALVSEDDALAMRLIATYFQTMLVHSEMVTLRRWLDSLSPGLLESSAQLSLIYAWTLLATGSFTSVERYLVNVEEALGRESTPEPIAPSPEILHGHIAAIRATAAINSGSKVIACELSLQALASLPPEEALPRALAALSLADALSGLNDVPAASLAYTEAYKASMASGVIPIALNALGNLGHLYERRGKLQQATATYEQALGLVDQYVGFSHYSSKAHIGLARVLYQRNNLPEARTEAEAAIDCARNWGHQEHLVDGFLCLAHIQWAEGAVSQCMATLAQAEPFTLQPGANPEAAARFNAFRASRWILLGRLDDGEQWAAGFDSRMEGDALLHRPGILTLARLRIAEHAPDVARAVLEQLLAIVERVGLAEDEIALRIVLALAYQAASHTEKALASLQRALALAAPEGYRRFFLDEGPALTSLLKALKLVGQESMFARSLLADLHPAGSKPTGVPPQPQLTRREQEVLVLIAKGASNQEIAETLVIALGTVKKHVTTIFAKVGVTSRTQLLARASELGLVQL
jgi:LuxR family maltose regulon positive regulatory protein